MCCLVRGMGGYMQLEGSHTFGAPRARVWRMMLDPAALAGCLPGCEGLQPLGDGRYEAVLNVKVGPVTGAFKSLIQLSDIQEPESYQMMVEGSGGPGGMKGTGHISMQEVGQTTVVSYHGDVQVSGTVARIAQRLIPSVAKMMVDQFFKCMDSKIAATSE